MYVLCLRAHVFLGTLLCCKADSYCMYRLCLQVSDLQAALQAVWPVVQPISSITREQLLSGSAADLVYKLLLCLAACNDMNPSMFEAVQVTVQPGQPAQSVPQGTAVQKADVQQQQAIQSTKIDLRQQIQEALSQVPQMPPQQQRQQSPVATQSQPPAQQAQGSSSGGARNTLKQLQQQRQAPEAVPPGYTQPQGPIVVPGTMPPYDAQEAARVAAAVGVNLEDLPPLAQQARGHAYDVDWMTGFTEQEKDLILKVRRLPACIFGWGWGWGGGAMTGACSDCFAHEVEYVGAVVVVLVAQYGRYHCLMYTLIVPGCLSVHLLRNSPDPPHDPNFVPCAGQPLRPDVDACRWCRGGRLDWRQQRSLHQPAA